MAASIPRWQLVQSGIARWPMFGEGGGSPTPATGTAKRLIPAWDVSAMYPQVFVWQSRGESGAAPETEEPQGGGGGYRGTKLPEYYSRRIFNRRVTLPQEPESHRVAVEVLNDASELEARLEQDDRRFDEMLEQVSHLLKQVATYIESQQIYRIVVEVQQRIQAKRDAEIAARLQEKMDDDEFGELIDLI